MANRRTWSSFHELRKTLNMSQRAIARELGVSHVTVNSWERMRTPPDWSMLPDLARVLEVKMEDLAADIAVSFFGSGVNYRLTIAPLQ